MSASLKANEPSMEEILASIRRIIADDGGEPAAKARPPSAEPVPEDDLDVLDLATVETGTPLIKPVGIEPLPQSVDLDGDVEFRVVDDVAPPEPQPVPKPAAAKAAPRAAPPPQPVLEDDGLLSPVAVASVTSAFQALSSTLVPHNARTLEDVVKDLMRPIIKSWLDENLPDLVERLVQAEIERVTRGPRG